MQHVHKLPHQQGYLMVKKLLDIVTTSYFKFQPKNHIIKMGK
jgi:hypothetical protein